MARARDPVALIERVCRETGAVAAMAQLHTDLDQIGVAGAVATRDTAKLFDWLMTAFSYQGVSNAAASSYLADHGNVTYRAISDALAGHRCGCAKLAGFEAYRGCSYRKSGHCSQPRYRRACPVPTHDLRKGTLNQLAYALYFFIRDVGGGDLVGFIDRTLEGADRPGHPDRIALMRAALLIPLRRIHGVSDKVLNMAFADFLLGADPQRTRWVEAGGSMIAVDRLVHNFLHRTGILAGAKADHAYGPACYRDGGCASIIDRLARHLDARAFDPSFPVYFPRFVQHAIWQFCAQEHRNICNGNQIDDAARCRQRDCPLYAGCRRLALKHANTHRRPSTPAGAGARAPPPS